MTPARRSGVRSSAVPLAMAWVALIVYASLFPFSGWRWPPGATGWALLPLPWPRYFIPFDITSNLLAYAPLGLLICLARLRHGAGLLAAMATALLVGAALSYGMELVQHLLPQRVPSSLDCLLNTAGALLGALLAALISRLGWLRWWQATRERWLEKGNGGALALLVLWPVALLFPAPVPLGVGQVGEALRTTLLDGLADVPWADPLADWLAASAPANVALSPAAEGLAVALGLLAPCLLAFAAARPGWRRLGLVAGVLTVAVAATSLSTVLNFGPAHALAWRTPVIERALGVAAALALAGLWLGPRMAGALALAALIGLVVLVHLAPTDPYFADSLQGWEQGQFVRFHGLAQWVGWLWPYAAMAWLLGRPGTN
jgi:VanZ family protein